MPKYFGTDGIRGVAFEFLNEKLAFKIGQALSIAFEEKEVVIGCDTRASSMTLAHGIAFGAITRGLHVKFAGVVSTPMIAYYSKKKQMIGIMVTASHNPYTDNGIKVFDKGYKSTEAIEDIIEAFIDKDEIEFSHYGTFDLTDDVANEYMELYKKIKIENFTDVIGVDSAHGANYKIAKKVLNYFQIPFKHIGNEPDGFNINNGFGSTHIKTIHKYVKEHQLALGFAYDGDGDRLLVCDQNNIYDGDLLIYIIANYLKDQNLLYKDSVVLTQMSNPGIIKAFKDRNIHVVETEVGDKYVSEAIRKNNYTIGGENSGHLLLTHLLHSGDGLLASMYILEILSKTNKTLNELTSDVIMYPQKLINIKNINKDVLKLDHVKKYIEETHTRLGENSKVLIRPSGTEPLLRVTMSHVDQNILDHEINQMVEFLKQEGEKVWRRTL